MYFNKKIQAAHFWRKKNTFKKNHKKI